ncbi:MAG: HEAT repeat domain-containing protein [Planctomycetota bacterium]
MNRPTNEPLEQKHWDAMEASRDVESEDTWEHVFALRKEGTRSVLEKALAWCGESDPFCRSIGVSILAQLGEDGKSYRDEAIAMIRSMIGTEKDHEVITSLISAVHFREVPEGAAWLISLAQHPSEDIRWRVAWGLPIPNVSDPDTDRKTIETLMRLLADSEPQVRDWATFSLSMTDEDNAQLRDALLERMEDTDFNTRSEAAVGLAKRKEPRGVPKLVECLKSDQVGELYVEAAEMYADPSLKPALVALKRWWDVDPELLDRAIDACSQTVRTN